MKLRVIFAFFLTLNGMAGYLFAKDDTVRWNEHRSAHFIIYYKDAPRDFIKNVEDTAEIYYQEITRNLGFTRDKSWSWEDRAKIFIYSDADDYVGSAKQAKWSHGAASAFEKEIRTFPAANGFFDSILPHELGHIIFREFVGRNPYIPSWLDEGVAMYQEKAKRWGANKDVKKAMEEDRFLPLGELSTVKLYSDTERELVDLFYAEAASIVYYLISEHGEFKFADFCRELKDGKHFEKALQSAYIRFDNLDELNKTWVDYLKHR